MKRGCWCWGCNRRCGELEAAYDAARHVRRDSLGSHSAWFLSFSPNLFNRFKRAVLAPFHLLSLLPLSHPSVISPLSHFSGLIYLSQSLSISPLPYLPLPATVLAVSHIFPLHTIIFYYTATYSYTYPAFSVALGSLYLLPTVYLLNSASPSLFVPFTSSCSSLSACPFPCPSTVLVDTPLIFSNITHSLDHAVLHTVCFSGQPSSY